MSTIPAPTIIREGRRTISLHVTPQGELVVKAPRLLPGFLIKQFIAQKEEWILKSIEKVHKRKVPQRQYQDGEPFFYLGREYTLHLGNYKEIAVKETFQFPKVLLFRVQKELESWYKKQAREIITQRVEYHAEHMHAAYKSIMFSDTKSKWGTCGPENDLQFNWRLVMAPLIVIDYVVIHELAHTKEKNHSERFWKLVGKYTLAYKSHKKWLNNHAHLLTF